MMDYVNKIKNLKNKDELLDDLKKYLTIVVVYYLLKSVIEDKDLNNELINTVLYVTLGLCMYWLVIKKLMN